MKAKKGIGARKPTDIELLSAIHPMNGGKTAPPTIDITMNDEAFFVFGPKSFIPSAKIVGNVMDMKKKIRYKAITESYPKLSPTIGSKRQHARA